MLALLGAVRDYPATVGVVMVGYSDRVPIRLPSTGRRVGLDSDDWRDEYGRRVDRLMKALKKQGLAVYWIGQPILRRAEANDDAQTINDIVREKAYLNGIKFIDIQSQFADEAGNYSAYGPDITGKSRLLRDSDGKLISTVEKADISKLVETGWKPAIPITVKARDGQTDLYGLMYRPLNFDPSKKYPIINQIYPGPQAGSVGAKRA